MNEEFFTPSKETIMQIFDDTIKQLKNGEITLEEANRIGANMPKGYEFQFNN
jgi:exonuclease VII small subunit